MLSRWPFSVVLLSSFLRCEKKNEGFLYCIIVIFRFAVLAGLLSDCEGFNNA